MKAIETMQDMYEVENGKDFEGYDYHEYNRRNKWGLSVIQLVGWGEKHKKGTLRQKVWIEQMLTDMNFHEEAKMLACGKYSEFVQEIENW